MFGINGLEFVVLGVLALVVLGPDKLPRYAAEAARFIRQVRRMSASAQDEVRRELGPEFQDISLSDLHPKSFVKKHLFDDADLEDLRADLSLDDDVRPSKQTPGPAERPAQSTGQLPPVHEGERPPYDADAT